MSKLSTTLVTVVSGSAYEAFSDQLFRSASEFFHPTPKVELLMLQGPAGWPAATMYRYHVLARQMPTSSYVFLSDADMRFEAEIGPEILPKDGITATLHPGYVATAPAHLPYERRHQSAACVYLGGEYYYCGGFVGGTRQAMLYLARKIANKVDADSRKGIVPLWHDESCLNRCLHDLAPEVTLSPSYCFPDDSSQYESFWPERYERKLVALDKTKEERDLRACS